MNAADFAAYERRVQAALADCPCDRHWPNKLCANCAAIVERYLREQRLLAESTK